MFFGIFQEKNHLMDVSIPGRIAGCMGQMTYLEIFIVEEKNRWMHSPLEIFIVEEKNRWMHSPVALQDQLVTFCQWLTTKTQVALQDQLVTFCQWLTTKTQGDPKVFLDRPDMRCGSLTSRYSCVN